MGMDKWQDCGGKYMIKLNFNNIPINYDEKYLYNKITKILKINKKVLIQRY